MIKKIKKICDEFDHDFDDPIKALAKIAKIVKSTNRIDDYDEDEDED